MTELPASLSGAREEYLALVADLRPELHRYCARLTGSVIEGEDIVQEALARGFYALSLAPELPPLRPWLFRIAHNAAIDFLRRRRKEQLELPGELGELVGYEDTPDPLVVRAALARFLALPVAQRSAIILKDVLGHSLDETAETLGVSMMAVKALLVRARKKLLASEPDANAAPLSTRAELERYAALFNARDWDGVRALIADDCRLDLVSRSDRRGKHVGMYFDRYEKADVRLRVIALEGAPALAAYLPGSEQPSYFILLTHDGGRVSLIRDFRYVPYIAAEAEIVDLG